MDERQKTILITGSSRGIGAGIAKVAKRQGYSVILHGRTKSEKLLTLAKELEAKYIVCDVTNEKSVVEAIEPLEKIDVLVTSAGVNPSRKLMDLDEESLNSIVTVNYHGTVYFTREVAKKMIKQGSGNIIHISSAKAYGGFVGKPIYASIKAAVEQFTRGAAKELAPHNIRVNCVAPGFVNTDMTKGTMSPQIQKQIDGILMGRMGTVEEIANPVLFLASEKASYVTGHILRVDGGITIQKN